MIITGTGAVLESSQRSWPKYWWISRHVSIARNPASSMALVAETRAASISHHGYQSRRMSGYYEHRFSE
jgi:hypothetical protein